MPSLVKHAALSAREFIEKHKKVVQIAGFPEPSVQREIFIPDGQARTLLFIYVYPKAVLFVLAPHSGYSLFTAEDIQIGKSF